MSGFRVSRSLALLLAGVLACSRATESGIQDQLPAPASIASRRPVPYNRSRVRPLPVR
jgi:hypothetical protein